MIINKEDGTKKEKTSTLPDFSTIYNEEFLKFELRQLKSRRSNLKDKLFCITTDHTYSKNYTQKDVEVITEEVEFLNKYIEGISNRLKELSSKSKKQSKEAEPKQLGEE